MPQWKVIIHSYTSSDFSAAVKQSAYGHVCKKTRAYVFVYANVCRLSHVVHLFFAERLHTALLGEMQETVVAQTNSSLSYWLGACHGGNKALSNNTPIKVWHSGRGVQLLWERCVLVVSFGLKSYHI